MTHAERLRQVAAETRETAALVTDEALSRKLFGLAQDIERLAAQIVAALDASEKQAQAGE